MVSIVLVASFLHIVLHSEDERLLPSVRRRLLSVAAKAKSYCSVRVPQPVLDYERELERTRDQYVTRQRLWQAFSKTPHTVALLPHHVRTVFAHGVLPHLPYVLHVIDHPSFSMCFSTRNVPYLEHPPAVGGDMLDSPGLVHVFAENWMDKGTPAHPKLTIGPIGLPSRGHKLLGLEWYTREIDRARAALPPVTERPLRILSNAHFATYDRPRSNSPLGNTRQRMRTVLAHHPLVHYQKKRALANETFQSHARFAFELCPEGNGLDTHRFYEATVLGTIPIVVRNSLTPLYAEHFPATLVLERWEDLVRMTEAELDAHRRRLAPLRRPEALRMGYWIDLHERKLREAGLDPRTRADWPLASWLKPWAWSRMRESLPQKPLPNICRDGAHVLAYKRAIANASRSAPSRSDAKGRR
jgi:hypothetical protein